MDTEKMHKLILLLISDKDVRTVFAEILSKQGYLVVESGDLGAAVDRVKEARPDLLIIRPYINSMPGHEAANYIRTKAPGLRVLMVGGLIDDARLNYRDALKNIQIFPKPFTAEQMLEAVSGVLK